MPALRQRDPSLAQQPILDEIQVVGSEPWWSRAARHRVARFWKPVALLLASRVITFFVVYVSRGTSFTIKGPADVTFGSNLRGQLSAWDGGWYLAAAQHGWPHSVPTSGGYPTYSTLAFFPGFPLAIRVVHLFGASWFLSGFLAALICQLVMAVLVWQLFKEIWGEPVADKGLLLFLFGPGALQFSLIYSEPMLLAAGAACLLALRRRWWAVAGVSAAVGTAVRPVGVALVACCAWEAFRVVRSERQWSSLVAPLLSPAGIGAWFAYLWIHTGDPLIWSKAEKAWDDSFDPFSIVKRFVVHEVTHTGGRLPRVLPVVGLLFCIFALILLWKTKAPSVLLIYSVVVVAFAASSKIVGLRPRLIETAFPLVFVFGYWLKNTLYSVVLAFAAVSLGGLLFLTLIGRYIP